MNYLIAGSKNATVYLHAKAHMNKNPNLLSLATPNVGNDVMPVKALQTLLKVAEAQGLNINQVLLDAGLEFDPFDKKNIHIQFVSTHTYSQLYRYLMQALQDEAFGMNTVGRSPPGTFRMMSLFIINCPNLQTALERCAEFFDFCDSFTQPNTKRRHPISIDTDKNSATCRFYNESKSQHKNNLRSDISILFMMFRFFSWLIGRTLPLQTVLLVCQDETQRAKYESLFGTDVTFGNNENALVIELECLQAPIIQNETQLRAFLKNAPYQLITRNQYTQGNSLTSRIIAVIGQDFSREFPSAEVTAKSLNMSTRTLHRRLRKENTSFQKIKDRVRKQAAIAYISHPELSISATALLMGFQDTSAFHRSFKKWTGMSPGEFRKQEKNIYPASK